jgi:CheY-like chemotaxis protein
VDIIKISLVNLSEKFSSPLTKLIKEKKLGSCKAITTSSSLSYFVGDIECTNFIVFYDEYISEEQIIQLKAPKDIPIILITNQSNFEMERTAKSNNIDLIINASDPELITLIYGFISQYQIYQSQHVLVVDDSRVDSCIITTNLTKDYLRNDNEHNPDNVIDILSNSESINIVILDYEMPNKNGCQLMGDIKATFPNRDFIFIGITGSRNGAIKFLHDGADDVLIKPLDLDIFSIRLRKLIFNFNKIKQERKSLDDYKNIIQNVIKDVGDPIYVLSTINDILLESAGETGNSSHSKLLCQTAKAKLTHTFTYLLGYLELSKSLHDPSLKNCSLHSMISGQLLIEASKAKLSNIIIKESLSPYTKDLHVPIQIEQVITYLTKNGINNSLEGSDVYIRLYPDKFNIIFEVEDTHISNKENYKEDKSIDYVLCNKIIDAFGGSMGVKQGENSTVCYFKLPSNTLNSGNLH